MAELRRDAPGFAGGLDPRMAGLLDVCPSLEPEGSDGRFAGVLLGGAGPDRF